MNWNFKWDLGFNSLKILRIFLVCVSIFIENALNHFHHLHAYNEKMSANFREYFRCDELVPYFGFSSVFFFVITSQIPYVNGWRLLTHSIVYSTGDSTFFCMPIKVPTECNINLLWISTEKFHTPFQRADMPYFFCEPGFFLHRGFFSTSGVREFESTNFIVIRLSLEMIRKPEWSVVLFKSTSSKLTSINLWAKSCSKHFRFDPFYEDKTLK